MTYDLFILRTHQNIFECLIRMYVAAVYALCLKLILCYYITIILIYDVFTIRELEFVVEDFRNLLFGNGDNYSLLE